MLANFIQWLGQTAASDYIQNQLWVIPAVQSVHIIVVAIVLSSVGMIVLRFFGLASMRESVAVIVQRYIPRIWWCLLVLLLTGSILIAGEPNRELTNQAFWFKMFLVASAAVGMFIFQHSVKRNPAAWEKDAGEMRWKAVAFASMLLFFAIAVAGRWIAYMVVVY